MAKRKFREILEVDNLEDLLPASNLTVHGVVTYISPVKKGKRSLFFDGLLADTTCSQRLFGFTGGQQQKLHDFHERKIAVEIVDCEVRQSCTGSGLEIMLKSSSEVRASEKKLDVDVILRNNDPSASNAPQSSKLIDVPHLELITRVRARVKAVKVNDPVQLIKKTKQDIIIANDTATARLTVWEDNIGGMEEGRCYELNNYVIHVYQSTKYLSRGEDSSLLLIEDIGVVARPVEDEIVYNNITILGVPKLDTHKCCIKV